MANLSYLDFKTPFFDLTITDKEGKHSKKLPSELTSLIEKIEVVETFEQLSDLITIVFVEGSREPFKIGSIPPDGTLKNTSSALLDFTVSPSISDLLNAQFDIDSAVNSITDLATNAASNTINNAVSSILGSSIGSKLIKGDIIKASKNSKKINYLFGEGNYLKITWGYIDSSGKRTLTRSISGVIVTLNAEYSDTSQSTLTVKISDFGKLAEKNAPVTGVKFHETNGTLDQLGNVTADFNDLSVPDMLHKICDQMGIDKSQRVISTLDDTKLADGKVRVWLAGESLGQVLWRLAKDLGCYVKLRYDPNTNKIQFIFISTQDLFKKPRFSDSDSLVLFNYKSPGSLIKNVSITTAFATPTEQTSKAVDEKGNPDQQKAEIALAVPSSNGGQQADNTSTGHPDLKALANVAGGLDQTTAKVSMIPGGEQNSSSKTINKGKQLEQAKQTVTISINCLGHPNIYAGLYKIRGLGTRFSDTFQIMTTKHIIDSSGYHTEMTGWAVGMNGGESVAQGTPNVEEPDQTSIKLTEAASSFFSGDASTSTETGDQFADKMEGKTSSSIGSF